MARKILLADDSVTAQNMGRKILADAGYEVITVNNGSAALKKIAELKPDLVVLDVYMPGYSGLEVCQRLKDAQETSRVPVLLTVGKLEPFKPEEAKRVRADGFIVKPFEASELLSALSKLEDKIVPRAEASKPGRFARATAAIEDGRYDRVTSGDDDSGWKNRISFPSQKKEKSEDSDHQDIRPVAERKKVEKGRAGKAEEGRVDMGALAPEGLPKDVTAEEIAALAAAAAQVKGKIAESRFAEPTAEDRIAEGTTGELRADEARIDETRVDEIRVDQTKSDAAEQTQPAAIFPQEGSATKEMPAATFAEQKSEEKLEERFEERFRQRFEDRIDASEEKSEEAVAEAASVAEARHSNLMAAIAGLEPDGVTLPDPSSGAEVSSNGASGNGSSHLNEPAALAAGVASVADGRRWTAVSVALTPEDAGISLEHEMQKAYAAFAAAEFVHTALVTSAPESRPEPPALASGTDTSLPYEELSSPGVSIPAMPTPEAAQALSELGNASTEIIRAAVQDLEMVAEPYVAETVVPASAGIETAPAEQVGAMHEVSNEIPRPIEAATDENPAATGAEAQPETASETKQQEVESSNDEAKNQEWKTEEPVIAAAVAPEDEYAKRAETHESAASAIANDVPVERTSASQVSAREAVAANSEESADVRGSVVTKESDATATTAAAWASWRRIRESGDPKAAAEEPEKEVADAAAMAVAAGAEQAPEQAESESDPAAIASIVDSVLADLRPKIFEEISRKMGKKK